MEVEPHVVVLQILTTAPPGPISRMHMSKHT